jgi:hypothetical protein
MLKTRNGGRRSRSAGRFKRLVGAVNTCGPAPYNLESILYKEKERRFMCKYISGFQPAGSEIFEEMHVGDEVKIQPGRGMPETTEEVLEIIVAVDGLSALTNTGRRLMCFHSGGLKLTGQHFEEGEYELSKEARGILAPAPLFWSSPATDDDHWS